MFLAGFSSKVEDCNLNFKGEISESPTKEELQNFTRCPENQRALFSERLQLEFIPFFSNKFKYDNEDNDFYNVCFDRLFEKIESTKNSKYIILLGKVYEKMLDMLVKINNTNLDNVTSIALSDNKFRCKIYHINDYELLVAPSFQSRRTQSYVDGYKYGQFCGEKYITSKATLTKK